MGCNLILSMGKKLLRFLTKLILFVGLLFGVVSGAIAQSAGDIAFVGVNSVSDEFAIVALSDLSANITIYFTDAEWDGNTFKEGEEDLRWQVGGESVPAGTIITFYNPESGEASASIGNVEGSNIDLASQNDALFAYTGPEIRRPTSFLAAISNHENQYNGIDGALDGTNLTEGAEAVLLNNATVQAAYKGERNEKSAAEYLHLIGDTENNWQQVGDQQTNWSMDLTPFAVRSSVETAAEESAFMTRIEGAEGWRGISSPTKNTSFEYLLDNLWVQGVPGSRDPGAEPTILLWDEREGGGFTYPDNMSNPLESGRGYFVYVSEDEDPNRAGVEEEGVSRMLATDEEPHDRIVNVPVSATDADESGLIDGMEGFNLLGNPFGQELSVGAVKEALQIVNANINAYLYVWNPELGDGNGGFEPLMDSDVIAPDQPFWVRYLNDEVNGIVRFDRDNLTINTEQEAYRPMDDPTGSFELKLGADEWFDTYEIELREDGEVGEDRLDAYKLLSLNTGSINLFSTVRSGNRLVKNVLPNTLEQPVEIPLLFSAADKTSLSFNWERPDDLPRDWDLMLVDQKMNREVNIRITSSYSFELDDSDFDLGSNSEQEPLLNTQNEPTSGERFSLAIRPSGSIENTNTEEALPESTRLRPNYPNPFASQTTISFELSEPMEVTLTIWNMIGQKVATLVDSDPMSEGPHEERWDNVSNMPSGMYIARLQAGGEVYTRKMTLIK